MTKLVLSQIYVILYHNLHIDINFKLCKLEFYYFRHNSHSYDTIF